MAMAYRPKPGSFLSSEQAQRYGEQIARLEEDNRDSTDFPGVVIQDARRENSPLHDWYEWDDATAGNLYRRHQTQVLLCSIEIEIINPRSEETEVTRAFHPIVIKTEGREDSSEHVTTWASTQRVLENPEWRKQLVQKAMRELESWRKKYHQYHELSMVFSVIDKIGETAFQPEILKS